jgi:hypothetical protein
MNFAKKKSGARCVILVVQIGPLLAKTGNKLCKRLVIPTKVFRNQPTIDMYIESGFLVYVIGLVLFGETLYE